MTHDIQLLRTMVWVSRPVCMDDTCVQIVERECVKQLGRRHLKSINQDQTWQHPCTKQLGRAHLNSINQGQTRQHPLHRDTAREKIVNSPALVGPRYCGTSIRMTPFWRRRRWNCRSDTLKSTRLASPAATIKKCEASGVAKRSQFGAVKIMINGLSGDPSHWSKL